VRVYEMANMLEEGAESVEAQAETVAEVENFTQ